MTTEMPPYIQTKKAKRDGHMKKEFKLTKDGVSKLENELEELIAGRSDIAEKLKVAREHGDLSENAEYHNARDEQAALEARISEVENILRNVEVVAAPSSKEFVNLGSTVVLAGNKGEQTYTLVGSVEANPAASKISDASPIGQALMGKAVGEEVVITLPAGDMAYKVKSIS